MARRARSARDRRGLTPSHRCLPGALCCLFTGFNWAARVRRCLSPSKEMGGRTGELLRSERRISSGRNRRVRSSSLQIKQLSSLLRAARWRPQEGMDKEALARLGADPWLLSCDEHDCPRKGSGTAAVAHNGAVITTCEAASAGVLEEVKSGRVSSDRLKPALPTQLWASPIRAYSCPERT